MLRLLYLSGPKYITSPLPGNWLRPLLTLGPLSTWSVLDTCEELHALGGRTVTNVSLN